MSLSHGAIVAAAAMVAAIQQESGEIPTGKFKVDDLLMWTEPTTSKRNVDHTVPVRVLAVGFYPGSDNPSLYGGVAVKHNDPWYWCDSQIGQFWAFEHELSERTP